MINRRFYFILGICLFFNPYLFSQQIRVISFDDLEKSIKKKNDTTYIVNFFASWCAPCLKELPEFVAFEAQHKNEKVKLLLVSLDFKKDYEQSLNPIFEKYQIRFPIFLLDEKNPNTWMNKIDARWSGGIPATYIVNHKKRIKKLMDKPLTISELNNLLK